MKGTLDGNFWGGSIFFDQRKMGRHSLRVDCLGRSPVPIENGFAGLEIGVGVGGLGMVVEWMDRQGTMRVYE